MTTDTDTSEATTLSPDDAFSVLGNETRMEILQTLGRADEPLSFSELRERVGMRDSGQFNYHLGKLEGHFITQTEDGYEPRRAGESVLEAVLSGAVTEAPVLERTRINQSCFLCGAPVEVSYAQERFGVYCTECDGTYGGATETESSIDPAAHSKFGYLNLPPAGVQGRTPREVLSAATTWGHLENFARASGVCPRCSAPLDESVTVCEEHDATDGLCDQCDTRYAIQHDVNCTNCIYNARGVFMLALFANTDLLAFMTAHGLNPVSPSSELSFWELTGTYEEEIRSVDPFEARFTFTIGDDALTLTVDDDLNVVAVTEHKASDPA